MGDQFLLFQDLSPRMAFMLFLSHGYYSLIRIKVSKEKCRLDVSSTEETREQNMP